MLHGGHREPRANFAPASRTCASKHSSDEFASPRWSQYVEGHDAGRRTADWLAPGRRGKTSRIEVIVETLLNGLGQLESPRGHDGRLWFADWTSGNIRALSGAHSSEIKLEHHSLPLCFDFLPDSTMVVASGPEQAILRGCPGKALSRYADLSALSPYGSNDIVVDGRGNVYVNNVNFDFAAGPPDGDTAPGFVALVTLDGQTRVVAEDLSFP